MRRAAFVLLCLLIAVPAMVQAAAQKKTARPAAPKPAATKAASTKAAGQKAPVAAAKRAAPAQGKAAPTPAGQKTVAARSRPAKVAKGARGRKAAKAESVPKADPALIDAYAAMPVGDRRALQSDLIWTGDYNGVVSDEFGDRSIAAVKSYQARSGAAASGLLTVAQRTALAAAAKAKQEASGWQVVDDAATGARLAVPIKHAPRASATKSGTRWTSSRGEVQIETFRVAEAGTTLAAVFEQQKKEPATREVEYSVLRENFFVISGLQGLKRFYVRAQVQGSEVRGFAIMYDQAMQGIMDPVAVAMSSRFEPFPRGPVGPPPRRKVEYATGIVVDDVGHIVTDAQATDGCEVITLTGLGPAERVATAGSVSLLRVYGARNLNPIAFSDGDGAPVSDVTLVGIADPQAQGGADSATLAPARVGASDGTQALDPAPAPGFSGAAALDARGRLVGMAVTGGAVVAGPFNAVTQARLVPLPEIRTLLADRGVAPPDGAAARPEAAKASVVRVICVRK
jgi:hypothetical protein